MICGLHTLKIYKPSKRGNVDPAYKDTFHVSKFIQASSQHDAKHKLKKLKQMHMGMEMNIFLAKPQVEKLKPEQHQTKFNFGHF